MQRGQLRASAFASETGTRQHEVWAKVRKVQEGLSSNLGVSVNAAASQSSLQLALENEKLKDAQAGYLAALSLRARRTATWSATSSPSTAS